MILSISVATSIGRESKAAIIQQHIQYQVVVSEGTEKVFNKPNSLGKDLHDWLKILSTSVATSIERKKSSYYTAAHVTIPSCSVRRY